jgi:hypothetical protein
MLGWTSFYFKLITDKRIGSLGDCYTRLLLLSNNKSNNYQRQNTD